MGQGIGTTIVGLTSTFARRGLHAGDLSAFATRPRRLGSTWLGATIVNPLSAVGYTSHPAGIRVTFEPGEVTSADYLTVYNSAGAEVPFQWEGATFFNDRDAAGPYARTSAGTWADGSLRAGTLWILATVAAGASATYQVRISDAAQSHSYTPAIAYTAVSGTVDELAISGGISVRFEDTQAWNMRRMYDGSIGGDDYFSSATGVHARMDKSGTSYFSYTAANVSQVSHGRVGETAFGYGVVFADYQSTWTWVDETNLTSTMRYRLWANGRVDVSLFTKATDALSTVSRRIYGQVYAQSGATVSYSLPLAAGERAYTSPTRRLATVLTCVQNNAETATVGSSTSHVDLTSGSIAAGLNGTGGSGAGASIGHYWSVDFSLLGSATIGSDTLDTIAKRVHNPLGARAHSETPAGAQARFVSRAAEIASLYAGYTNTDTWQGVRAACTLFDGYLRGVDRYADAAAQAEAWLTAKSLTPTAEEFEAGWAAATNGFEFSARNMAGPWYLYRDCLRNGRDPSRWVTILTEYADFCVIAESRSVGGALDGPGSPDGTMLLRGDSAEVFNATSAAIVALTRALTIRADAAWTASLARLVARLLGGVEFGTSVPYTKAGTDLLSTWVENPALHYAFFTMADLFEAGMIDPTIDLSALAPASAVRDYISPSGSVDERRATRDRARRGYVSTLIFAASALALNPDATAGDYEEAATLLDFAISRHTPGGTFLFEHPMEGYAGTGANEPSMDIRCALAALETLRLPAI